MMGDINFFEEGIRVSVLKRNASRLSLQRVLKYFNIEVCNLNFIFSDDLYLNNLNLKFLQHEDFTDVITFDYTEEEGLLADIFISYERVKENAKLFHVKLDDELQRVMIHGVLHLCGYKDKLEEDAKLMREMETMMIEMFFKS